MKQTPSPEDRTAALMGTLAGGLAHEIKTPLSTLDMNLQLLEEEWRNPVSEREQRSYRKVLALRRSVQKLEEILRAFIRFAQEHKLHLEPVSLNAIIDDLLEHDLKEYAVRQGRSIQVVRDLSPALPRVSADRALIRQAVLNLLLNAVDAIEREGCITVRTGHRDGFAELTVADDGAGIPVDNLPKIWNLYFTTKPSGIGLGLPTTKRIVEAHHGTIDVASQPGRGTSFTIRLPL